ncbi:MAG: hypothetical protein RL213_615 [Bacteroidota bacterium]|jgi:hypothetical protein
MDLSDAELEVLSDTGFFLVKRSVTEKLDACFSGLQRDWKKDVVNWRFPVSGVDRERGKIFRGENYKGLPYVIMDFPKLFERENVFAVRTMCRWGHEFSVTLHLQGASLQPFLKDLYSRLGCFNPGETYFCVNRTPWEYDFGELNYRLLSETDEAAVKRHTEETGFLKVAVRLDLAKWRMLPEFAGDMIRRIGIFLGR